ncbi:hypothetical protein BGZ99_003391, partial [Dissophora globulifera]
LPERVVSVVGGVNYYLSEVRNVIGSPDDTARLFGCPGKDVKILGLDLGQACVVGSSLLQPEPEPGGDVLQSAEVFHNQSVKTKAVMQPIFKLRRWMEFQKGRQLDVAAGDAMEANVAKSKPLTIQQIESTLPPLSGPEASVLDYTMHREKYQEALEKFYNGDNYRFKKHTWDARRAKQEEYSRVANELLKAVGGSIGTRRHDDNKVVIAIGLSKFQTKAGLASLDGTFSKYFIQL